MRPIKLATTALFFTAIAGSSASFAQDAFFGKPEFVERCAVCHGVEGAGDGAVGALFAKQPSDLRLLAKNNGGMYPFNAVYEAIDGRRDITAHGATEMPIWGDHLMAEAGELRNMSDEDAGMIVEARILALVYYLQSIQLP